MSGPALKDVEDISDSHLRIMEKLQQHDDIISLNGENIAKIAETLRIIELEIRPIVRALRDIAVVSRVTILLGKGILWVGAICLALGTIIGAVLAVVSLFP